MNSSNHIQKSSLAISTKKKQHFQEDTAHVPRQPLMLRARSTLVVNKNTTKIVQLRHQASNSAIVMIQRKSFLSVLPRTTVQIFHHHQLPSNSGRICAPMQRPSPPSTKVCRTHSSTCTATRKKNSTSSAAALASSSTPVANNAHASAPSASIINSRPAPTSAVSLTAQTCRVIFTNIALNAQSQDADLQLLSKAIAPMLAQSTWSTRAHLLKHLYNFLATPASRPDLPLDARVALFILKERAHCAASTRLRYAKDFRAMAHAIGMLEHPTLDMFIRATAARAAEAPIKQAQLATKEQIAYMMVRCDTEANPALAASIYLCFKTCSRWGDIANLNKDNFIVNHPSLQENELLVMWGTRVKTSRLKPFRATGYTIVREITAPATMAALKRRISSLRGRDQKLCPKSTDQMLKWLRKDKLTSSLTCHSFKRTALDQLTTAVLENRLAPSLLPLMAKHQDRNLQHFPESTIRYLANKVAFAKILKTQDATELL